MTTREQSLRPEVAQGTCVHAETEPSSFRLSASFFLPFILFFIRNFPLSSFFSSPISFLVSVLLPLSFPASRLPCRVGRNVHCTRESAFECEVEAKLQPQPAHWDTCLSGAKVALTYISPVSLSLSLSPCLFLYVLS